MEPDPTGLDAGLNPYSYAGNNPVNSVDPTGLNATEWLGGMMTESYNWLSGNGFNWAGVNGALADGYNSGTFSGVASSAAEDIMNFGAPLAGKALGSSLDLAWQGARDFVGSINIGLPEFNLTKAGLPTMSNGMTMQDVGRDIIQWGSGPKEAALATQNMTSAQAQTILKQVTPQDIQAIGNFYSDTAAYLQQVNPTALAQTQTPILRAELMQQILKKAGY